jgi:hypothetical protein
MSATERALTSSLDRVVDVQAANLDGGEITVAHHTDIRLADGDKGRRLLVLLGQAGLQQVVVHAHLVDAEAAGLLVLQRILDIASKAKPRISSHCASPRARQAFMASLTACLADRRELRAEVDVGLLLAFGGLVIAFGVQIAVGQRVDAGEHRHSRCARRS